MNTENPTDLIKKARPNIKESTIKMYVSNLNKLKKVMDSKDFKFLKDISKVKDKLGHLHFTSQRNYYNSIIIFLMAIDNDKELIEKYNKVRDELNDKYVEENSKGVISDKQKNNFVELSEVNTMLEEMRTDLVKVNYKKATELKGQNKTLLQAYTIFSIHTKLPLRNDLADMISITKRAYNKLSETDKKEHNYLVVEKTKMWFVLNKYKTSKKYEELKIDIPKDLEKTIRIYLRINGNGILFKTSTGNPITRNALSQLLIKYSKKYMNKNISTTMLRKIVLSDKFSDLKQEQKEMSKITGHSVDTMNNVYVKQEQKD